MDIDIDNLAEVLEQFDLHISFLSYRETADQIVTELVGEEPPHDENHYRYHTPNGPNPPCPNCKFAGFHQP